VQYVNPIISMVMSLLYKLKKLLLQETCRLQVFLHKKLARLDQGSVL